VLERRDLTLGPKPSDWATVDADGRLILPAHIAARLGLTPGAQLRIDEDANSLRLHRPITHLARLYVEPTDACNLDCITCFRNAWQSSIGRMSDATFAAILAGVRALPEPPTVYFGGIGEPLVHTRTIAWIAEAKALGARVEMITNGTLLDEGRARALIAAGLDLLWVSIDGARPESYADVRLGAELPTVLANLERLCSLRPGGHFPKPEIGVAFVAMKRNIADLPEVLKVAKHLGARHFSVSNVVPVTEELQDEVLYTKTLRAVTYMGTRRVPRLVLPKMDFTELTRDALFAAFDSGFRVNYAGNEWSGANDVCTYIESGSLSVGWNGDVSPCWPLLHSHQSYLHGKIRTSRRHVIGNVRERDLLDLWLDPAYIAYRQRVHNFVFPPCTFCGGCEVSVENREDCFDNEFPVCGACLWAQGVVQCP
jgi:MoaA/NifB/PqqE/SkfB family radical SAM enzyme